MYFMKRSCECRGFLLSVVCVHRLTLEKCKKTLANRGAPS
ncbi:hypothetical protein [uncultured Agrobacterium sp.]